MKGSVISTAISGEQAAGGSALPYASVEVILVNFRSFGLTCACLASLEPEIRSLSQGHVIVVENGSQDESATEIASAIEVHGWRGWVSLLISNQNLGFAGGNNRAFMEVGSQTKYILLLNSDTIVHRGCLKYCYEKMEREPRIGLLSCMVENADGSIQNVARKTPNPVNQLITALGLPFKLPRLFGWANTEDPSWDRRTTARDVGWIGGAFMFARCEMIRQTELFDSDFFFYGEDVEFCHRVRRHGWRVHFDPAVSIAHLGGGSSDPTRLAATARSIHQWQARYLIQRKCHGRLAEWFVRLVDLASYAVRLCWLRLCGAQGEDRYRQMAATLTLLCRMTGAQSTATVQS